MRRTLSSAQRGPSGGGIRERPCGRADGELFVETERGRTLALTFHPMADGGTVVLFEDITDRKMAEAKIHQLARYDSLDRPAQPRALPRPAWTHR